MCSRTKGSRVFGVGRFLTLSTAAVWKNTSRRKATPRHGEKRPRFASVRALIFCNRVCDMLYGHRKDVNEFGKSLEEFDRMLGFFGQMLSLSDMLMITADHGCDP